MSSRPKLTIELPQEFIALCADHKVKPETVLRGFIADVCGIMNWASNPRDDGYGSNGSDERDMAYAYYERCGYPWMHEDADQGHAGAWCANTLRGKSDILHAARRVIWLRLPYMEGSDAGFDSRGAPHPLPRATSPLGPGVANATWRWVMNTLRRSDQIQHDQALNDMRELADGERVMLLSTGSCPFCYGRAFRFGRPRESEALSIFCINDRCEASFNVILPAAAPAQLVRGPKWRR